MSSLRVARVCLFLVGWLGLLGVSTSQAWALAGKKEDAEKYTKDLKTSKDPKVRVTAIEELAKIGQIQKPLIKEAMPLMIEAMSDKEPTVKVAALKAVGMVDPDVSVVLPIYKKSVAQDQPEAVRIAGIQGLAAMGPSAKPAVPELRKITLAEDKKSQLYRTAQQALRVINVKK